MHIDSLRTLQDLLRMKGIHITAQRKVILDVLLSRKADLTAEGIYSEVRQINAHINLATVYRTLARLREAGIVQHYHVSPEHSEGRFRLADLALTVNSSPDPAAGRRFHFRCLKCGQITELVNTELVDTALKMLESQLNGGQLSQVCMCLEGYCPTCARNQERA
ncbi:MAG TPA: transcriptional repressor [Aggregatilineales bacterium]|nr:transcriptional repressor [Aggregatilineales bacterium]